MLPTHVTEFTLALSEQDNWRAPAILKLTKDRSNERWWWTLRANGNEVCMFDARKSPEGNTEMAATADLAVADFRAWLKELDTKIGNALG